MTEAEDFPQMEKKIVKLLRQKTEIKCHMSNTTEIPESKKNRAKAKPEQRLSTVQLLEHKAKI